MGGTVRDPQIDERAQLARFGIQPLDAPSPIRDEAVAIRNSGDVHYKDARIQDLLELARLAEERRLRVAALTEDQERQLVSDPALLLTTVCVLNRWTFERIVERYGFTTVQLTNLLVRLDRIGLIELLPAKRIRLRVARNFAWLPGGPIHRYFVDRVQGEFLSGEFEPERDLHRFSWGMLSDPSSAQLRAKIAEVMDAFDDLTRRDEVRADAAAGTCFLVALRRWEPTAFRSFRHSNLADAG